jgi:Mrp family chromosome partitioning ATPase
MILLDTAPLLTTNDASELLAETDQVLIVVRSGKTKVESARRVTEVLSRFDAPVIGILMNDSREAQSAQYYYGNYTYTTSSSDSSERAETRRSNGSSTNGAAAVPPDPTANGGSPVPEAGVRP